MSSGVDSDGVIAAAVLVPGALALGAGWLAWQGGKLLVEANRAANRQIAEKKRQLAEAARHRKMAALSAHGQLADMCAQIVSQIELGGALGSTIDFAEAEQLKYELQAICSEVLPENAEQIENITSQGYMKLDGIIRRQRKLASVRLEGSDTGLYSGLSVADLMDDLRVAIGAMTVHAEKGSNVAATEPDVLERIKLNEEFSSVTARIMEALEAVSELSDKYGLTSGANAWFSSCFNGIDALIAALCRPTTGNAEFKKGVRRLEEAIAQYDMMAPGIEKEARKMAALYAVYRDAAGALGEKAESMSAFSKAEEIEGRLRYFSKRAERAAVCAEICRKLGPSAYLCYAWDQELQALGYSVHSRKEIAELASQRPEHAMMGDRKMPFYRWGEDDLTQLYSAGEQCDLQVIVHEDGTVSMQTIASESGEEAVSEQIKHCSQLSYLHKRLRENWFVLYDYEETASPETVLTAAQWRSADENEWRSPEEIVTDRREKEKPGEHAKYQN